MDQDSITLIILAIIFFILGFLQSKSDRVFHHKLASAKSDQKQAAKIWGHHAMLAAVYIFAQPFLSYLFKSYGFSEGILSDLNFILALGLLLRVNAKMNKVE